MLMTSLTGLARLAFAVVVVAVAMTAAGLVAASDGGDDGKGETFDWLRAENGRRVFFNENFATADAELAAGFVATGITPHTITLTLSGEEYHAVLRGGRYYSNEENPDDSLDIPASAEVLDDKGRRLFASKGYRYMGARIENAAEEDAIVVRYYRGVMGCGIIDYHLQQDGTNLTITKAPVISTKDDSICPPQQ